LEETLRHAQEVVGIKKCSMSWVAFPYSQMDFGKVEV